MTGVQTCALPICFPVTIGQVYRAGYTEPTPAVSSGQSTQGLNVWVGYNQVVWGYDEESDTVQQFSSRADATSHPIDAPLFAWLGAKAAADEKAAAKKQTAANKTAAEKQKKTAKKRIETKLKRLGQWKMRALI